MKWLKKPNNTIVSIGKPVVIPCEAEGSPQPKINWKRLDQNNDHHRISENSELRFNTISIEDSGIYECTATNSVDEDLIARIQLEVRGK